MNNKNNFKKIENINLFKAQLIMLEFEVTNSGHFIRHDQFVEIYNHHIRIGNDIFFNIDLPLKYIIKND